MIPVIDGMLEVVLLLAFETFHSEVIYDEQVQMLDRFKELEYIENDEGVCHYAQSYSSSSATLAIMSHISFNLLPL